MNSHLKTEKNSKNRKTIKKKMNEHKALICHLHMLIAKEVSFSMGDPKEESHYVKHSLL